MNLKILTDINQVTENARVYIWGNGKNAKYLYNLLNKRTEIQFCGFIVNDKLSSKCVKINEIDKEELSEATIIITPLFWLHKIIKEIKHYNVLHIYVNFLTTMNREYIDSIRTDVDIARYGKMFENGDSEWNSIMNLITLKDISRALDSKYRRLSSQYIEFDLMRRGDIVIDGGACFADETKVFRQIVGEHGMIHAFDPYYGRSIKNEDNNIYYYNLALSQRKGKFKFDYHNGASSALIKMSEQQGDEVETISIDEFITDNHLIVNFIKLDVEGAEKEVIHGARMTITKYKPNMAIAVYHCFDDFFDIIDLINSYKCGYKFKFAGYSNTYSESILYAYK